MKQKFMMWVWLMAGLACAVTAINIKDLLLAELLKAMAIISFLLTARAADTSRSKNKKREPAPVQTPVQSRNNRTHTNPLYTLENI